MEHVELERDGEVTWVWMSRPERRNALSLAHLRELLAAFQEVGRSPARGVVLAGRGSVFSAGHDFSDMAGAGVVAMRELLWTCTQVMDTIQGLPQVVVARVHGVATAAGCQLVASADLAVAAEEATFATPGGKGGWFCHTPMVAVARSVPRKAAMELALTGDSIDATTALGLGLVNRVVPAAELDEATLGLLERATRGSAASKAMGKQVLYAQMGMDQDQAYRLAVEAMAAASQMADAQEGMEAFLQKRAPKWVER